MLEEFIKGKVYCKIFDKNYQKSSGVYIQNKFKDIASIKQIDKNIQAVKDEFQAKNVLILKQIHSNIVISADEINDYSLTPEADGSISSKPNIVLAIQTADCVPILFASDAGDIIGAAHCGWKGLKEGMVANIAIKMRNLGASKIKAIIGPSIAQKSYEVNEVYYQNFINDSKDYAKLFIPSAKESHYMFDISAMAKIQLANNDIELFNHIDEDTYALSDKYPSYRRSTLTGEVYESNILSAIMIKG